MVVKMTAERAVPAESELRSGDTVNCLTSVVLIRERRIRHAAGVPSRASFTVLRVPPNAGCAAVIVRGRTARVGYPDIEDSVLTPQLADPKCTIA
jgi:hypothetical protein